MISHVRVPLLCIQCFYTSTIPVAGTILSDCVSVYTLCTQCFYTSTIPVAGTILSDCVSVHTLCTNVSTLVLYQ